jgi:hypothetical protein
MDAPLVQIGTTNRCNERCTFCPNPTLVKPKGVMSWDTFVKIVDSERSGIYDLCLFGEPLLDPQLCARIAYIRKTRPTSEIYFHTNGLLLKPEMTDRLVEAGLSRIVVSVYGFGQKEHEKLQVVGPWEILVANVQYAAAKMPVMVVGSWLPDSETQILSERFWQGLGATTWYNEFIEYGDATSAPKVVAKVQQCTFALGYKTFDYDGNLVMCCMDFENHTHFGNIATDQWDEAKRGITQLPQFCKTCPNIEQVRPFFPAEAA